MAKRPINGFICLNKPSGMTSMSALAKVKWLLKPMKAGHAGTLDPMATGVLPLALGEATKTINIATDATKTYRFTVTFGTATDTDDAEGATIAESDIIPTLEAIEAALPKFTGAITQYPPLYSAKKVAGERAYDLAREGIEFTLEPQNITVFSLKLLEMPSLHQATLVATCSKGTYVRSLARDLAVSLGTVGHVSMLHRVRVGNFTENDAISLEKLEEIVHNAPAISDEYPFLLPVEAVLDDIPVLHLHPSLDLRIRQGQTVVHQEPSAYHAKAAALIDGKLIAIGQQLGNTFKPERVINP